MMEARYYAVETATGERITDAVRFHEARMAAWMEEAMRGDEIADVGFATAEACSAAIDATKCHVVFAHAVAAGR